MGDKLDLAALKTALEDAWKYRAGYSAGLKDGVASQQAEIEQLKAALAVDYRDAPHLQIKLAEKEAEIGRALKEATDAQSDLVDLQQRYKTVVEAAREVVNAMQWEQAPKQRLRAALAALEGK